MAKYMTASDFYGGPYTSADCKECGLEMLVPVDSVMESMTCEECDEALRHEDCEDHPCEKCLGTATDRAHDLFGGER